MFTLQLSVILFCWYIAQKWRPRISHTQTCTAMAKEHSRNTAKQRTCFSSSRTHLRDIQFTHLTWQEYHPRILRHQVQDTGEDTAHHRLPRSSRSRWSLLEPSHQLLSSKTQRVSRAPSFAPALSAGAAACRLVWSLLSWPVSSLRWSNTFNYCQLIQLQFIFLQNMYPCIMCLIDLILSQFSSRPIGIVHRWRL